jgi:2',3'-cyclic-nucleotide 2'-phosphodiesterase (5'-nucleotidase family)
VLEDHLAYKPTKKGYTILPSGKQSRQNQAVPCTINGMIKLTILHTNDIHGRVTQLSRIASLVREIRRQVTNEGNYCLYVDGGDSEDTTMLESSLTKGSAMEALLRAAGAEYVALGNAIPIRYGHQAVSNLAKHFGRPLLCANMKNEYGNIVDGLQPMAFEMYGPLKVALIGLTDPADTYSTFFKLQMSRPAEILPGLISAAKSQGAKTIIVLSHLSSKADIELAENVQGIDVILGAHDHKELYPPILVNDTIIVQAGDFGRLLGRLDITLDVETGKVLEFKGELLPITEDIPLDNETQLAMERERVRARELMNLQVGILNGSFELSDDRECAAGNLLADALLDRVKGTQLSMVLAGHWDTGLEAGLLTQGRLFTAIRSTANPAKAELSGSQILHFLRESLKPENAARKTHALRGRAIGKPHISGARVRHAEDFETIEVEVSGEPLEPSRKYVVASTDMEFADYIGYLVLPFELMEFEVPTIMPEVLQDYIQKYSPIEIPADLRVTSRAK